MHHGTPYASYGQKLARALKSSGELWVVDFTMETRRGPPKPHRIEPEAVAEELASAEPKTRIDRELLSEQYVWSAAGEAWPLLNRWRRAP